MARVLIVDDEESLRLTLGAFLEGDGHAVETARDATEATQKLTSAEFDVVLCDIILPRVSGTELLQNIRNAAPAVRVIMMTGEPTIDTAADAVRAGASDYLVKPFPKDAVIRSVRNAVAVKALHDEQRRLEQENAEYSRRLEKTVIELSHEVERREKAEKAKDEFLSVVSHELRTPIAILKEAISLLHDEVPGSMNRDQRRVLDTALKSAARLRRLIDDLLDISRIETKELTIERQDIDLVELVTQVSRTFGPVASRKGLLLECEPFNGPFTVSADGDRIRQLLANLVENAVNHTDEGVVTISVARRDANAVISVRDTGVGISPDTLPYLFERFVQGPRVNGPGYKGVGLGLAIAKEIVELHGGTIEATSTEGEGSVFTVTLPAENDVKRARTAES